MNTHIHNLAKFNLESEVYAAIYTTYNLIANIRKKYAPFVQQYRCSRDVCFVGLSTLVR